MNTVNTAEISLDVRHFHAKISSNLRSCIKLFYFEYGMDTGVGLAKLMHRTNILTNIYLPHTTPDGELFAFWNGGANVKQFSQTPRNQTNFFKTSNSPSSPCARHRTRLLRRLTLTCDVGTCFNIVMDDHTQT